MLTFSLTMVLFFQEIFNASIYISRIKKPQAIVLIVDRWTNDCLLGFLAMIKNWANMHRFVLQVNVAISIFTDGIF